MVKFIDLTGQKFGKLTVIERAENQGKRAAWLCRCECGSERVVEGTSLRHGRTNSCGCLHAELSAQRAAKQFTKHSMTGTPEHIAYVNARQRCNDPNIPHWNDYGGRGIKCLFTSFEQWYAELGPRPSRFHSVDRIDVNGHYEPGNVRWATWSEQARNKRPRKLAA